MPFDIKVNINNGKQITGQKLLRKFILFFSSKIGQQ